MLVGARPEMTCLSVRQAPVHSEDYAPNVSIAQTLDRSVMVRPTQLHCSFRRIHASERTTSSQGQS
jgi:hypothetical protein